MRTRTDGRKPQSSAQLAGALLALLRTNAKFTQRALADKLCASEETVASIEQGRRALLPDMAERIDRVLGTGGVLGVVLQNLPRGANFAPTPEEFFAYEREAIVMSSYEKGVVPGLLQTEAYARAVFRTAVPALSEDEIERRVATRMERQALLHRKKPPTTSFVIAESVLLSSLGGRRVMREQIRHLRDCADLPGVSIQVLELSCDNHAGLSGPFLLLETPAHQHLAYVSAQRTREIITDPAEVSILEQKHGMLRSQSLNGRETVCLLERLLRER
ncbi:helix-turn-helix domain-containing protein [Streptomyces orinoci]|uniref:Helix-turn-helix transcriptional regulator n=1 Tax=Streptomyces orinoci TaxID=67339 RepID=A0ABV3JTS4_STRON|nr:helix-turn-helix transcriptional regulator [Streptomyces orinoci]